MWSVEFMLRTLLTIKDRRTGRCEVFIVSEKRDYYEVLGLSKGASDADIKLSLIHI